jgi:hypothetical protein
MKPFSILVIVWMISSLGMKNLKAQEPQKINYEKISGITSLSIYKLDTTKLTGMSLIPDMATSKLNNQSLKKVKPKFNKIPFYDTDLFKTAELGIAVLLWVKGYPVPLFQNH